MRQRATQWSLSLQGCWNKKGSTPFWSSYSRPNLLPKRRMAVTTSPRYLILQEWRNQKGIDTILEQPQPAFEFAKDMYGHGVVCFTRDGQPVWVDKIADMKRTFAEFKVKDVTMPWL